MPDISNISNAFPAGLAYAAPRKPVVSTDPRKTAELKKRLGEFTGGALLAPALQEMQKSPFKTKYSSGGHAEDVFQGQMALELSKKIGRAAEHGFGKYLYEAAMRQTLAKKVSA